MCKRVKVLVILGLLFMFIGNSLGIDVYPVKNKTGKINYFIQVNNNRAKAATVFCYWDKYTAIDGYIDNAPWVLQSGTLIGSTCVTSYSYDQIRNSYSNQGNSVDPGYELGEFYNSYGTYIMKYVVTSHTTRHVGRGEEADEREVGNGSIYRKEASQNTPAKIRGSLVQSNIIAADYAFFNDSVNSDGYWYVRKEVVGNSPEFTVNTPIQSHIYSKENLIFEPVISVQDKDNSSLTCKYYIDAETNPRDTRTVTDTILAKQIRFSSINISSLSDGEHTIKFVVNDNLDTVTQTVKFIIDNTGPVIGSIVLSSTDRTISVESLSSIDSSGINALPYRFSIGSNTSNWISNPQYTFSELMPNTVYIVKCETRDAVGNIETSEKSIYTKVQPPTLVSENTAETTTDLRLVNENPDDTQYQIMCDSKYVDSSGTLIDNPTWINVSHKIIKIVGLSSDKVYKFTAKARNKENIETAPSSPIEVKTCINTSITLIANSASTSIVLSWNSIPGFYEYELEADGVIKTLKGTTYTHIGLKPNTQHSYRIRAKNLNGVGDWSPMTIIMTQYTAPENILNIKSYPTNTTVSIVWDAAKDAEYYEIEFDGTIISNIKNYFHTVVGLVPVTQYTYRVRAINSAGDGEWSNYETVTTYLLSTPSNINTVESEKEIALTWDAIDKVAEYEIEINGQTSAIVSTNSYKHTGLTEETQYIYRIKAKNANGESAWSNPITATTLPLRPGIPSKFRAFTDENIVTLSWDSVDKAIGYDVELDGVLIDNGDSKIYIHEDLSPTTVHKYRVRAKTDAVEGEWTDYILLKTMAGEPIAPQDIKIETTPTITTLSWKAEEEALGYDIEIDGMVVSNITSTSYRHRRITPLTEHVYRIRTRNITGVSRWSGYIINNSIKAICKKNKDVDLGLTASDIIDFSKYTLTVKYNKDVLDVTDLCTFSSKIELTKGNIEGTGITIIEYSPGKIVFVVDKSIPPGESWTGVINSIKFKAKVSGGTNITYTVFSKPEE